MATRNINKCFAIWNLINAGKSIIPDKIKLTYRYKKSQAETCHVYIFGLIPDETKPVLLAGNALLYDSECPRERAMTTILELNNVNRVTDIYMKVAHYEVLQDLYYYIFVGDPKDIPLGRSVSDATLDCGT